MAEETKTPPTTWWLTGYMRAMHDFAWLSSPEAEGQFFRSIATIEGFAGQITRLEKQLRLAALLSFVGASVILAGGFPREANVELLGLRVPASLISLQLLAVFVSACFVTTLRMLGSYAVLMSMIDKVLEVLPAGREFVLARYDASHLLANILRPRQVGYESPFPHLAASVLLSLTGYLLFALQVSIVGAALWKALSAAWVATGAMSFLFFISLAAAANFVATLIAFALAFFIKVPYRPSKELQEYWARKTAADAVALDAQK